ncbi:putative phosphatidate cytidylyltransferase [Colletotrichum spaethianum]|uniref:Phosphatidate cytidylyltransferase n=1 Tax=Colletotrichum spaethianum TaxID=700344 RepID=A0AA37UPK7_9PEZI|nr:putative phosphatidate cytidylyltransferase [Colletotrichum spaethianum]GKT50880.1 putative phosphatidate cytidylyltransferase [Colletotrichum spaethianum]
MQKSNIPAQDWNIHDPDLSSLGLEQCQELRDRLLERFGNETDALIIVSPMRRTIQTALLSLDWLIKKGVRIRADARWQENSAKPCDTGSSIINLKAEFPDVDFSTVDPVYPEKTSLAGAEYAFTRDAILRRAQAGVQSIRECKEKIVFVVSHAGFLRLGVTGYWFFNGDYRMFELDEDDRTGQPPKLRQLESTLSGGLGKSRTDPVVIGSDLPVPETPPPHDEISS